MPPPVWVPGQVLSASDVNNWLVPSAIIKLADQSKTSNTTLGTDNELTLAVAASATYRFEAYLNYEGGTGNASDIKYQWTVPAGAALRFHDLHQGPGGTPDTIDTHTASTIYSAATNGAGNLCGMSHLGTLLTAGSSGNVFLSWAQNTTNGTPTIVHAQSCIILQRLS